MTDQGKLYQHLPTEVAPPPEVWRNILDALDEMDVNKIAFEQIAAHEETPPADSWSMISGALAFDEEQDRGSLVALLEHQQEPPADIWQGVLSQLEEESHQQKPVVTIPLFQRRSFKIGLGVAVAAGLAALILLPFNQQKNEAVALSQTNAPLPEWHPQSRPAVGGDSTSSSNNTIAIVPTLPGQRPTVPAIQGVPTEDDTINNNDAVYSLQGQLLASNDVQPINTTGLEAPRYEEKQRDLGGNVTDNIDDFHAYNQSFVAVPGPDGSLVHLSTKLTSYFGELPDDSSVASGGIYKGEFLDHLVFESAHWRQMLEGWKTILADTLKANPMLDLSNVGELLRFIQIKK